MGPIVPEICTESGGYKKIKHLILVFFNLVGPIFLLSAQKRTERSIVYGLNMVFVSFSAEFQWMCSDVPSSTHGDRGT